MFARAVFTRFRFVVLEYIAVACLFALGAKAAFGQNSTTPPKVQASVQASGYTVSAGVVAAPESAVIPIPGRPDTARDIMSPGSRRTRPRVTPPATALKRKVAQEAADWRRSVDYSGPRFGVTYLPQAAVDSLKNHHIDVNTTITQFGWQLEREIHVSPEGPMILNEWVFLAGGLESGVLLPSVTWLIGARGKTGNEIGFGPNLSVSGVGL